MKRIRKEINYMKEYLMKKEYIMKVFYKFENERCSDSHSHSRLYSDGDFTFSYITYKKNFRIINYRVLLLFLYCDFFNYNNYRKFFIQEIYKDLSFDVLYNDLNIRHFIFKTKEEEIENEIKKMIEEFEIYFFRVRYRYIE